MLDSPHLTRATAQVLRELRAEYGLTQAQLAGQASVSRSYLAYLEAGQREPSLRGLISLAKVFGFSGWELAALIEIRGEEIACGSRPL